MKRHRYRTNVSEFADLAFSNVVISDSNQAINMGCNPKFRQGLLIKHIRELAKKKQPLTDSLVPSALGGCWQQWIDC